MNKNIEYNYNALYNIYKQLPQPHGYCYNACTAILKKYPNLLKIGFNIYSGYITSNFKDPYGRFKSLGWHYCLIKENAPKGHHKQFKEHTGAIDAITKQNEVIDVTISQFNPFLQNIGEKIPPLIIHSGNCHNYLHLYRNFSLDSFI